MKKLTPSRANHPAFFSESTAETVYMLATVLSALVIGCLMGIAL